MKRICMVIFTFLGFGVMVVHTGFCDNQPLKSNTTVLESGMDLGAILNGIDTRYDATGFTAGFVQTSTLKALEISDTASGRILIKRPAMMRWEYEIPEKQTIISDGTNLWVHRPEDNQVMIGAAPVFFSEGKGAGFLSDIKALRDRFDISLGGETADGHYVLKLIPLEGNQEVSTVYMTVVKNTFYIVEIVTLNVYDDETRIRLNDIRFENKIDDALFKFEIPHGVDVVQLGE